MRLDRQKKFVDLTVSWFKNLFRPDIFLLLRMHEHLAIHNIFWVRVGTHLKSVQLPFNLGAIQPRSCSSPFRTSLAFTFSFSQTNFASAVLCAKQLLRMQRRTLPHSLPGPAILVPQVACSVLKALSISVKPGSSGTRPINSPNPIGHCKKWHMKMRHLVHRSAGS